MSPKFNLISSGLGRTVEPDAATQVPGDCRARGEDREADQGHRRPPGGLPDARGGRIGQDRVSVAGAVSQRATFYLNVA